MVQMYNDMNNMRKEVTKRAELHCCSGYTSYLNLICYIVLLLLIILLIYFQKKTKKTQCNNNF